MHLLPIREEGTRGRYPLSELVVLGLDFLDLLYYPANYRQQREKSRMSDLVGVTRERDGEEAKQITAGV